jgi:hypothetical protein
LEDLAKELLGKLLRSAEKSRAGVRSRAPALTKQHLAPYLTTRSLAQKEAFDAVMLSVRADGCITVTWDSGGNMPRSPEEMIQRVDLVDADRLAQVLGLPLHVNILKQAELELAAYMGDFPVLREVFLRWAELRLVRGYGPDEANTWRDAVRVIQWAKSNQTIDGETLPIREASARLFKDSKRIEKLASLIDVLLSGDLSVSSRPPDEVLQEIGLFREEQPMRLAGDVDVERSRVTAVLDEPYAALPAATIVGVVGAPRYVMTIENLTTFHSEARRRCRESVLLVYTGGMPSPMWRAAYLRLLGSLSSIVEVFHWGDVDEGGFRIAALVARDAACVGKQVQPWRMHPNDVPVDARRPASDGVAQRMSHYAARAGWNVIAEAVIISKFTVEQEALGEQPFAV